MEIYKEYRDFSTSLIANEDATNLIVIVESDESPNGFTTDEEPGPADIFDNLHRKYNDSMDIGGINLAVISYSDQFVRDTQPLNMFEHIEKRVQRLADLMGIDSKKVGVIICSSTISKKLQNNPYDHINVIAKRTTPHSVPQYPVLTPKKSKFAWTHSVPTWMYTKTGSVKEDGAGVNLLGFVVRAGAVVMFRQTEISIYEQMAAYHAGKFGKLKIVETIADFKRMMRDLRTKRFVSIDTEGVSLARITNTVLALQFTTVNRRTDIPVMWVLPVQHAETPWTAKQLRRIKKALKFWLEHEASRQIHVYQNAKFDIHQWISLLDLRWYSARIYDVMAGSFTLEENQKFMKPLQIKAYSLEHMEMCAEYVRPSSLVIAKADRGRMAEFSMKDIAEYGVIDVLTPLFLMFEQIEAAKNRGYPGFLKFVTRQIGVMLYTMTEMEHNGVAVDIDYLREIASPIGPLAERIRSSAALLANSDFGQIANTRLVEESSFQKKGMFGNAKPPQLWNIRNKKHLTMLFFDILGLQPMGHTKDGEGKLDKLFQKTYRHTPEVKMYGSYQKLGKLKSAFANAIYKYMMNHMDMKIDYRLRPSFTYTDVLTGRSSTRSPSTQQIPTHGPDAKIIKKQFKVRKGRIRGKSDYAGHEVRVSGNISRDPAICGAVDRVNEVQMNYRLAVTQKELDIAAKALAEDGDLHVQNYYTFFEVKISKKDDRRQDAKAAVFAVTYGSMAKSIGKKMHSEALYAVEDQLLKPDLDKATKAELTTKLKYLRSEQAAQDYHEKAVELLKVLSKKWGVLTEFIENEQATAQETNVVFGPHGRPRHLWGYLHFDKFVHFAMNRRVFNSEGQGYASDYGFTGIYLAKKAYWDLFESRGHRIDLMQDNAVHDSSFCDMDFRLIPLYAYVQEHAMISLTQQYYKKHWNIVPTTQYGFDIEFGIDEADMMGWDGRSDSLAKIIEEMAPKAGISEKVKNEVLKDNELMGRLRMEELRSKNPYKMTLYEDHIYDRIVPRLRCLR